MPFFTFSVQKKTTTYKGRVGSIVRYDQIHWAMQEFCIQINTNMIMHNLNFAVATACLLDFDGAAAAPLVADPANASALEKASWERQMH